MTRQELQLAVFTAFKTHYPFRQIEEAFDFADTVWTNLQTSQPEGAGRRSAEEEMKKILEKFHPANNIAAKDSRETTKEKPPVIKPPLTKKTTPPVTGGTNATDPAAALPPMQSTVLQAVTRLTQLGNTEITGRHINAMCDQIGQRPGNLSEILRNLESKGHIRTNNRKGAANTVHLIQTAEGA